ncbi:MAG: GNAT family N-acetyltransferase [Burkholderiales bacterium]|nr:GNAT family N-acetyltransferase [Burkholderiales bacterium]
MPSIHIATYTSEHQQGVIDLILPIQREEFGLPVTIDAQPDLLAISDVYQRGCGQFWLALDGAEVVGTIALLDIGLQQVALRKMFVRASHRGAEFGVAKALLNTALQWSREKNLRDIYLGTTAHFHAAHRFYEKNGFVEVAANELPENFSAMQIDTKFYRLDLATIYSKN